MTSTVFAKIQMRRGTAAEWAAASPILAEGEFAFEIDTGITKVGDGASDYATLPAYATYSQMLAAQEAIEAGQATACDVQQPTDGGTECRHYLGGQSIRGLCFCRKCQGVERCVGSERIAGGSERN